MGVKFTDRLTQLGFASYNDYLSSERWKGFKSRYRASGRPLRCAVCNGTPIQLHHHTYERLGDEWFDDMDPLCREHHVAVHDWLKERKWPVAKTAEAIACLRGEPIQSKPKKNKRKKTARPVAPQPLSAELQGLFAEAKRVCSRQRHRRRILEWQELAANPYYAKSVTSNLRSIIRVATTPKPPTSDKQRPVPNIAPTKPKDIDPVAQLRAAISTGRFMAPLAAQQRKLQSARAAAIGAARQRGRKKAKKEQPLHGTRR